MIQSNGHTWSSPLLFSSPLFLFRKECKFSTNFLPDPIALTGHTLDLASWFPFSCECEVTVYVVFFSIPMCSSWCLPFFCLWKLNWKLDPMCMCIWMWLLTQGTFSRLLWHRKEVTHSSHSLSKEKRKEKVSVKKVTWSHGNWGWFFLYFDHNCPSTCALFSINIDTQTHTQKEEKKFPFFSLWEDQRKLIYTLFFGDVKKPNWNRWRKKKKLLLTGQFKFFFT